MSIKTHFSAEELAQMRLPGLPSTSRNIRERAKKEGWQAQKRQGVGGGCAYHVDSLPDEAQTVLREKIYQQVLATKTNTTPARASKCGVSKPRTELNLMRQCPALLDREVSALTEKQKLIADARAALAMEVEKLRDAGMSRTAAVNYVSNASRNGTLPEHLIKAVELANARKGSRTGVGTRSLQEWLSVYESTKSGGERLAMLAPGHLKAKKPEQISWLPDFLAHWRSLNGPSMREAYRGFCKQWQVVYAGQPEKLDACPSYDAVRRAMVKLPRRERAFGRVSGSAKLAYETYQKRDWSMMPVNGCWIADGKSLDLVVQHPLHGKAFTPELTLVLDGRTRYCVGWSLALSESMIAVLDAYRYGMQRYGKPLFVYSDIRIHRFHIDDVQQEFRTEWIGTITEMKREATDRCRLLTASLASTFTRSGLRLTWGRACPYSLYDHNCGILPQQFGIAGLVITALDGASITVNMPEGLPGDWFSGGYAEWISDGVTERRGLRAQNGSTLGLFGGSVGLETGQTVTLYPGCDRTISTCNTKFNNVLNYGGQPHMPGKSPYQIIKLF